MNRRVANAVVCATTVLSTGWGGAAIAQDKPRATQDAGISEVVVTARRLEERLQDVPISITVFDQEQLAARNVVNARDLALYTPSLIANSRFGTDNTTFTIRGFTQEQRTTASVGTYFADVVMPRGSGTYPGGDGAGPGYFFDLQNVQVLKGPQGTLFGRNTTGGAVLLVPRKPSGSYEGYLEASYGNRDMQRLEGVMNMPLSDSLRVRAGVDWQQRDGYLENISQLGPKRFADVDYVAARLSAVADLTQNLENYTIVSFSRSSNAGLLASVDKCFPTNPVTGTPTSLGALACAQIAREASEGFYAVSNTQPDARSRTQQWQAINTTTWLVTDLLTVKNVASYAEFEGFQRQDFFGFTGALPGVFPALTFAPGRTAPGYHINAQSTLTEELQLQGRSTDNRLIYQIGAYMELADPLGFFGVQNPTLMACADPDNFICPQSTSSLNRPLQKTSFRTLAAYGQASYELTDRWKLTAGMRYTDDRVRSWAAKNSIRFPAANSPVFYCVDPSTGPTGPVRPGDFSNAFPIGELNERCIRRDSVHTSAPTWLIGLDYNPADDVLLYGKYARGYRQGTTVPLAADGYNAVKEEQVDNYELGAKVSWDSAVPGYFNVAAFYNDFTDQQLQLQFQRVPNVNPSIAPTVGIVNVGSSEIYGAELEAGLSLFEGFNIDGSYAYLHSELSKVDPVPSNPLSLFNVVIPPAAGRRLPLTPLHKSTLNVSYKLPLPESVGKITIGGTYSRQGPMTITYTANGDIPGYELINANIGWSEVLGSPIDAAFFITNLADEEYYVHINDQQNSGFVSYYLGEPRMYGFRLRYRFGD